MPADHQRDQFHGRLKRISKGGPNTMGQIYVGPPDAGDPTASTRPHFGIGATILAFLLGGMAYLLGHLGQFHLLTKEGAPVGAYLTEQLGVLAALAGDVALAVILMFLLNRIFRLKGIGPGLVGAIGLFAMMGLEGQAIIAAPDLFTQLYSAEFVGQYTETQSAIFRF